MAKTSMIVTALAGGAPRPPPLCCRWNLHFHRRRKICFYSLSLPSFNSSRCLSHLALLSKKTQEEQYNRISRFTDVPGSEVETLNTELELLTSSKKFNELHSSGWLGFKPSAYRSPVRKLLLLLGTALKCEEQTLCLSVDEALEQNAPI